MVSFGAVRCGAVVIEMMPDAQQGQEEQELMGRDMDVQCTVVVRVYALALTRGDAMPVAAVLPMFVDGPIRAL